MTLFSINKRLPLWCGWLFFASSWFFAGNTNAKELPKSAAKFYDTYCLTRHVHSTEEAVFSLEAFKPNFQQMEWINPRNRMYDKLAELKMPPEDAPRPSDAKRDAVAGRLQQELETDLIAKQQAMGTQSTAVTSTVEIDAVEIGTMETHLD